MAAVTLKKLIKESLRTYHREKRLSNAFGSDKEENKKKEKKIKAALKADAKHTLKALKTVKLGSDQSLALSEDACEFWRTSLQAR